MLRATTLLALVVAAPAFGISNDRLCKAIGDTPNAAVPPRDRAFFEDHCVCINGECAYKGGARHSQLRAAVKCELDVEEHLTKKFARSINEEPVPQSETTTWGVLVEADCMRVRSAKSVLGRLAPLIDAQVEVDGARARDKLVAACDITNTRKVSEFTSGLDWAIQERVFARVTEGSGEKTWATGVTVKCETDPTWSVDPIVEEFRREVSQTAPAEDAERR